MAQKKKRENTEIAQPDVHEQNLIHPTIEAKLYAVLAIHTLATIAADPDAPATARVAAASKLLERGFGRHNDTEREAEHLDAMDDALLKRLLGCADGA